MWKTVQVLRCGPLLASRFALYQSSAPPSDCGERKRNQRAMLASDELQFWGDVHLFPLQIPNVSLCVLRQISRRRK